MIEKNLKQRIKVKFSLKIDKDHWRFIISKMDFDEDTMMKFGIFK